MTTKLTWDYSMPARRRRACLSAGRVNAQIVLFFSKNGYNKNNENKFFKKY